MREDRPSTSLASASVHAMATLTGARVVSFSSQIITFALLASHLGPGGLGVYTFGLACARLFGDLTNFGFKQVVTRDAAQHPDDERWLLPNFLYLRMIAGVVGFAILAAGLWAVGYHGEERAAGLIAGTLLVLMAVGTFSASLEIRLRFGWVAIADVTEALLMLGAAVVLRAHGAKVLPFLVAYVAANFLNGLIVMTAALRTTSYDWRPDPSRWLALARAAVPLGLASIFWVIYWQVDIAILTRLKPIADVGQYGAAYRVLDAANVLPVMMMVILGPVMARSVVEGPAVAQRRFALSIHLVSLVAIPVAVLGVMTGWRVLPAVRGFEGYERGAIALSLLAPAIAFIFLAMVVQGMLVSSHRQRVLVRIAAIGAVVNLALNLALIPALSLYGSAAATTATELLVLALSVRTMRLQLGMRWPVERLRAIAAATAVMAIVTALAFPLPPFLQVATAIASYALAALLLRAMRWTDLGGLLREDGPVVELERCGILTARTRCRGAATCVIRADAKRAPWRTVLGARLAGCGTVVLAPRTPISHPPS